MQLKSWRNNYDRRYNIVREEMVGAKYHLPPLICPQRIR